MKLLDAAGPYWRECKLFLALLAAVWLVFMGYHYRDLSCKRDAAERESAAMKAQRAETERWQKIANDTDDKLQKALKAIPKTRQKVEEAVRAHPTSPDCRVPDDVIARLQDGIRAGSANTAP